MARYSLSERARWPARPRAKIRGFGSQSRLPPPLGKVIRASTGRPRRPWCFMRKLASFAPESQSRLSLGKAFAVRLGDYVGHRGLAQNVDVFKAIKTELAISIGKVIRVSTGRPHRPAGARKSPLAPKRPRPSSRLSLGKVSRFCRETAPVARAHATTCPLHGSFNAELTAHAYRQGRFSVFRVTNCEFSE